jgi:hypothetical protein
MPGDQVSFALSDYGLCVSQTLKELWQEQYFTDITLATSDDQQISAHKIVLSSFSPFFKNVIFKYPQEKLLLYLKDISYSELISIIDFVYSGQCQVGRENLDKFLSCARELQIIGLIDTNKDDLFEENLEEKPVQEIVLNNLKAHTNSNLDGIITNKNIKKCTICNKGFKVIGNLLNHMKIVHNADSLEDKLEEKLPVKYGVILKDLETQSNRNLHGIIINENIKN